ncbi:MAG: hypothetical protein K1X94_35245, partial [Sandaracinaceae bacterium]|nr:hypothetical protein [Sandaracinaceae bacterium]
RGDVPAAGVQLNTSAQQLLYASSIGVSGLSLAVLALALHALSRRRVDERTRLVAIALACLGTPLYAYATSFYGHVPAAALLTAALEALDPRAPRARLPLAGFCLGAAVGCEYLTAVPGAVLASFAVLHGPRDARARRVSELALGALAPVLVLAGYHQLCFGAPWLTGYSHLANPEFVSGHQRGLLGIGLPTLEALVGLLVSPRRGLFVVAPVAIVGVVGLVVAARHGAIRDASAGPPEEPIPPPDRLPAVALAALVALFLANAGYYMWWGGAAIGPRHLVPMLPALALGIAQAWSWPRARPWVAALGVLSIGLVLALTAVGLEAPESGNVLFDYALARLSRAEVSALPSATNLGLLLGLPPLLSLVPWFVWLVLVGRVLWIRSAP